MAELDTITTAVRDALAAEVAGAVICEYPYGKKLRHDCPVVAVGIKSGSGISSGFAEYMGEFYDAQRDTYSELYGKRMELSLGVFIYSPKNQAYGAGACMTVFGQIAAAISTMPSGLRVHELTCGETRFDAETGMFLCQAELRCTAFMYASRTCEEEFLSFTLRGAVSG